MEFQKPDIKRILFATDLSENAGRAFGYAASMADAHGATVTILHVLEKIPPKAELMVILFEGYESREDLQKKTEAEILDQTKSFLERYCAAFEGKFPACPLMVDAVVVETGEPAQRILHHAHHGGYDAVVMGSRGFGIIQGIWMGSTSRGVLSRSRIPVFIVPPGAGHEDKTGGE